MTQPDKLTIEELETMIREDAYVLLHEGVMPIAKQLLDTMRENERLRELLNDFLTDDAIANYDSKYCWGCGEWKEKKCLPECFLEKVRQTLNRNKPSDSGGGFPATNIRYTETGHCEIISNGEGGIAPKSSKTT